MCEKEETMHQTTQELNDMRDLVHSWTPTERLAANKQVIEAIAASGMRALALKPGDTVKDFSLPDTHGKPVSLSAILNRGPAVISFYRGGWCPFCNVELHGLQRVLPQIRDLGASLIAISPQLPDYSLSTEEKNGLTFPVLSDVGNYVARQFGIVFALPSSLIAANKAAGRDFTEINGESGASELPMPATFIVDSKSTIRLAFVEEDWTRRLDPEVILDTLRTLKRIDKRKLRDALFALEGVSIREATLLYESHLAGARIDLSESDDQGQRSQNEQSGTEAQQFEAQSHIHESHRKVIEAIDFGPKDAVEIGALVKVNDRHFLVAVPTPLLHVEGIDVLGISAEAPLFKEMQGLRAGETFEFNNSSFLVADVQ